MAAYNAHFPIRVSVQQNGSHVLRVLINVTDIYIDLEQLETRFVRSRLNKSIELLEHRIIRTIK